MIINHNLSAMNTLNALNKNSSAANASLKKLSTGYRINGASDDAAGLAISEKMRGQISGLKQASANAQDGISLLQTAEGGLDQTHSILQRMRELAVQSANDTNTTDDRQKIQAEVDQLAKEISRISNTTEFNTQNLLAGGLSDTFHIGANANQNMAISVSAMDAQSLGVADNIITAASVKQNSSGLNISSVSRSLDDKTTYTVKIASHTAATYTSAVTQTYKDSGSSATFSITAVSNYTGTSNANYLVKVASTSTAGTAVNSITYSTDNGTSWTTVNGDFTTGVTIDGMQMKFSNAAIKAGDTWSFGVKASQTTLQLTDASGNVGSSVTVHKGDTSATVGDSNLDKTVSLSFDYSKLAATGVTTTFVSKSIDSTAAVLNNKDVAANATVVAGINVSTQANANKAITAIDKAINAVSKQRSALGAYQNRLTNTIDNLNTSNENITSSESRIRDVDMSEEMTTYQKNSILQQAANAMLAKANQQPQTVLQLLQG
ncbi:flagellin [Sporomusa acidovorans]|uniref:Flagellin n=1 Tax=Sporomusa acidovorans (strain ATCC 49682 / DSM 3132 / Mol) TaxID=1123286 RepID=A0ABZ3J7I0_SPOA4|nr:flagellin [Sporomusa acidovorans]OZC19419.1 flagellin [Sporomusa acidovorans DSM 3132]SDD77006.1 flagellin [Sporomusa acidovorans]